MKISREAHLLRTTALLLATLILSLLFTGGCQNRAAEMPRSYLYGYALYSLSGVLFEEDSVLPAFTTNDPGWQTALVGFAEPSQEHRVQKLVEAMTWSLRELEKDGHRTEVYIEPAVVGMQLRELPDDTVIFRANEESRYEGRAVLRAGDVRLAADAHRNDQSIP